jgi:hypothetical protein
MTADDVHAVLVDQQRQVLGGWPSLFDGSDQHHAVETEADQLLVVVPPWIFVVVLVGSRHSALSSISRNDRSIPPDRPLPFRQP